jgi:multidrug efflux system membrane fusion protein
VDAYKAKLSDSVGQGTPVLTYTGTAQVVSVELPFDYRQLARRGATVIVKLPNDKTVPGKVTDSVTVIKPASSAQDTATTVVDVSVTVNDPKALAGLETVTLDVAFPASQRKDVLTVPVAALLALSEGGYGVQLVEGSSTRLIAVETGLFAGGRVEISGNGVTDGATVGMPG